MAMWFSSWIQHTVLPSNHDRKMVVVLKGVRWSITNWSLKLLIVFFLYKVTSLKGNQEPKLTMLASLILTYMSFHKVLYKTHYFSIFILVICFTILINAILQHLIHQWLKPRGKVIQNLELITNNLFLWFKNNHMKANAEKCHLLVTRDNDVTAKIEEFDVKNSREEKLFAVKIDTIFSFENHFPSLCKKTKPNLHAFPGIVICRFSKL